MFSSMFCLEISQIDKHNYISWEYKQQKIELWFKLVKNNMIVLSVPQQKCFLKPVNIHWVRNKQKNEGFVTGTISISKMKIQIKLEFTNPHYRGEMYYLSFSVSSAQFSCTMVSNSLQLYGLQRARPPCPSPTPKACSNSCPSSRWCHPTISPSVVPFSSCLPSIRVFSNESLLHIR